MRNTIMFALSIPGVLGGLMDGQEDVYDGSDPR
jgi:hypothetical protein